MRTQLTLATGDMSAYLARRRALLGGLTGTVLEIGAGAGANFADFRSGMKWLGLEPDPGRGRKLAANAASYGHRAPVITAPAERIPLGEASVDAVAATAVLCSVADQDQVPAEVRRVLRPGGWLPRGARPLVHPRAQPLQPGPGRDGICLMPSS